MDSCYSDTDSERAEPLTPDLTFHFLFSSPDHLCCGAYQACGFCLPGWAPSMLQDWWESMCCACWPPCTSSAGRWWAATCPMSVYSKPRGPTTSTWVFCCWCYSSACCLWPTPSCPSHPPSTVGPSGVPRVGACPGRTHRQFLPTNRS